MSETDWKLTVPADEISGAWVEGHIGQKRPMAITLKRTWLERLFTRPWRPLLNGVCYEGDTMLTGWELGHEGELLVAHMEGIGPLTKRLVRT